MGWADSPQVDESQEDLHYVEQVLQQHLVHPDAIYSSALCRARRTAEYFAAKLTAGAVQQTAELNEINYGTLVQKPKKWVAEHYPGHKKDPDFVYPGGESFSQLQLRAVAFIASLAMSRPAQTILCVVHAGVVRTLISYFLGLELASQLERKVSHRYVGVVDFDGATCSGYDEWGQSSGFVSEGQLRLPYSRKTA